MVDQFTAITERSVFENLYTESSWCMIWLFRLIDGTRTTGLRVLDK